MTDHYIGNVPIGLPVSHMSHPHADVTAEVTVRWRNPICDISDFPLPAHHSFDCADDQAYFICLAVAQPLTRICRLQNQQTYGMT